MRQSSGTLGIPKRPRDPNQFEKDESKIGRLIWRPLSFQKIGSDTIGLSERSQKILAGLKGEYATVLVGQRALDALSVVALLLDSEGVGDCHWRSGDRSAHKIRPGEWINLVLGLWFSYRLGP